MASQLRRNLGAKIFRSMSKPLQARSSGVRSFYMEPIQPLTDAPVYHPPGYEAVKLLAAGLLIVGFFDITGFNDWVTSFRRERNSEEACEERRKRCESAKADLEKLERQIDAVKVKQPHVRFSLGPRRTPRKAWGWGAKTLVSTEQL